MPVRGDGGISPSYPSQGSQHVNDNACAIIFVPPWSKVHMQQWKSTYQVSELLSPDMMGT